MSARAVSASKRRLGRTTANSWRTWGTVSAGDFFLGWQTFRVEEAFCVGQVGGRVVPESALESTRCLALIERLSQDAPLRQILRLQLGGGEGVLLARGRDQSHAAADQEHRRGDLASARAPLVIAH